MAHAGSWGRVRFFSKDRHWLIRRQGVRVAAGLPEMNHIAGQVCPFHKVINDMCIVVRGYTTQHTK
jgi:hypothetical protein